MSDTDAAPARHQTIAIIGAGIVGVSTAVWLQREGFEVILIDRAGPGEGTSYGNGGILASCSVVPVTVPGLVRKAPGMLLDRNSPLFLRWSYLPKLLPWLSRYLLHTRPHETRRIAAALEQIVGDSLEQHLAIADDRGRAGELARTNPRRHLQDFSQGKSGSERIGVSYRGATSA